VQSVSNLLLKAILSAFYEPWNFPQRTQKPQKKNANQRFLRIQREPIKGLS